MSLNIFTLTTLLVYELLSCNTTKLMTLISSKGIIFKSHEDDKSTENQFFYLPVVLNLTIGAEGTERFVCCVLW